MSYVLIRQKVQNYAKWKNAFDESAEKNRRPYGSQGGYIFRDADDPDTVSVLLKWNSAENMQRFLDNMKTDEMQQLLKAAGVLGPPLAMHVFSEAEETLF
ncbi:hypothetical protein JW960_18905 [candidate division KSB1 bacterium]|nr:hypothetical protein [candidate division KSB1 bacterium]